MLILFDFCCNSKSHPVPDKMTQDKEEKKPLLPEPLGAAERWKITFSIWNGRTWQRCRMLFYAVTNKNGKHVILTDESRLAKEK